MNTERQRERKKEYARVLRASGVKKFRPKKREVIAETLRKLEEYAV